MRMHCVTELLHFNFLEFKEKFARDDNLKCDIDFCYIQTLQRISNSCEKKTCMQGGEREVDKEIERDMRSSAYAFAI